MNCPRCERGVLDEREREGIQVDVCKSCRGVWLDRGELEKLIARSTREFEETEQRHARRDDTPSRGVRYGGDDDDDDDRRHPQGRKRGWFQSLGDIFD